MKELQKIFLDARELEHPEPLEKAIKILQSLDEERYFYMLHRKNPIPLLDLAKEHQFHFLSHKDTQEQWHILICKNSDIDLSELLDV